MPKYIIIGAGPTGISAAHRLSELGEKDVLVLERNSYAGGLSASFKDSAGYTWDVGGHVIFSHYKYFDELLESLLGSEYLEHQRIARIRMAETWVNYPFQNNIRNLPPEPRWDCVQGLLPGRRPTEAPRNFKEWILCVLGEGIARNFMLPYNFKVWATPPELMSTRWLGERVSIVDLEMVLKNIILEKDDVGWGPNNVFKFPLHGGTGEIFRRLARRVEDRIRYNAAVVGIDARAKRVRLADGSEYSYDVLFNTGPLDLLIRGQIKPEETSLHDAAAMLEHNGVHVIGVGTAAPREDPTCWMYFPEKNAPFYRVTNFHNYSPHNVEPVGKARGLMAEISFSPHKHEDENTLVERTVAGLEATTLLDAGSREKIVSTWQTTAEYGYPVPTLRRDEALSVLQPWLQSRDIYSRGRFGGWKYEVGNMDHSVMQGVEWANMIMGVGEENTYKL